jgi:hypothetical protein
LLTKKRKEALEGRTERAAAKRIRILEWPSLTSSPSLSLPPSLLSLHGIGPPRQVLVEVKHVVEVDVRTAVT